MRPLHRARQFCRAFRRRDPAAYLAAARVHLSPEQIALFGRMSLYDQEHAVEVLERLKSQGWTEPELMQAALLHDAGKAFIRANLWRRVAHVLVRAVRTDADFSREYARHAAIGAEMAGRAGSSPTVAALIREHHKILGRAPQNPFENMLAALQSADEAV
jgi:response regulator RpfG family c-di-GMP phosphodiesterase